MKKSIIYAIMLCIIIAGGIVIGVMGLEVDITYSKNVRIDVYLGKNFDNQELKQVVQEVFNTKRVLVQKVEFYEDMASITIGQDSADNIEEKIEQLNTKLNEKYELENKTEDISVTYQPKITLSDILKPYLWPIAISSILILIYVMFRFKKIGILKTLISYILSILVSEALALSILAIGRIPVNRLVMPIGLLIYVVVITIVTVIQESKYHSYQEVNKKKK